jgi:membrane-bound metal-dependent hydrolase YbcI (DUF457 family)
MPITPLHLGVLAPINHFFPRKVSNVSFTIVNLWIDAPSILYTLTGYGAITHSNHAMWYALLLSLLVGIFKPGTRAWWLGAIIGGVSHILLDMLVHVDMEPFAPLIKGNLFCLDLMQPLSLVLLVLCGWLVSQYVSGIRSWVEKIQMTAPVKLISIGDHQCFWRSWLMGKIGASSRLATKNITFAVGLSWLIYGALNFDYPDWDIGISLVMAIATYFTADKVVNAIRKREWRRWPMMLFYTWFAVDGSYVAYWFCKNRHVLLLMRDAQWPTSLCLFLLCGIIWTTDWDWSVLHQRCRNFLNASKSDQKQFPK